MPGWAVALALSAAAVAAVLSAPASVAGVAGPCFPGGSTTLAQHDGGRVFFLRSRHGAYACSTRYGRVIRLAGDSDATEHYSVNRRWVIFLRTYCEGAGGCFHHVVEKSLKSGRKRFIVINGRKDHDECGDYDCGEGAIGALRLKPNGSAAWVACPGHEDGCDDQPRYVIRRDRRGKRILDHGKISSRSLRLSPTGRMISWINAGRRRSASLR